MWPLLSRLALSPTHPVTRSIAFRRFPAYGGKEQCPAAQAQGSGWLLERKYC